LSLLPASILASTGPTTPTFVLKWGNQGAAPGQFVSSRGLAADALGNIYVADMGNNRIEKFTSSGAFLLQWGIYR
jgi:DNA-binding beta-propeller fold protein YncE